MNPIQIDDILGRERYGTDRDAIRRRLTHYKRARRVSVGPHLTFIFEDRVTVWYQIQEMLWVEQITDLDAIRAELDVYNGMLPQGAELSATLLIEIADQQQVVDVLNRLVGIDECVTMEIADRLHVRATFEPDRQTADKVSAVQYVRFPINGATRAAVAGGSPITLRITHPHYTEAQRLPAPLAASLAAELQNPMVMAAALRQVRDGD